MTRTMYILFSLQLRLIFTIFATVECEESESFFGFKGQSITVPEAMDKCRVIGLQLARIVDRNAQTDLETGKITEGWTAGYFSSGSWKWDESVPVTSTNWDKDEPKVTDNACILVKKNKWKAQNCQSYQKGFICQGSISASSGISIYEEENKITGDEAQDVCKKKGMNLYQIDSEAENMILLKAIMDRDGMDNSYWIGAYNPTVGKDVNTWVWRESEPMNYMNFKDKEPNESGPACAAIKGSEFATWKDHKCDHKEKGYICKVPGFSPGDNILALMIPLDRLRCPTPQDSSLLSGHCIEPLILERRTILMHMYNSSEQHDRIYVQIIGTDLPCQDRAVKLAVYTTQHVCKQEQIICPYYNFCKMVSCSSEYSKVLCECSHPDCGLNYVLIHSEVFMNGGPSLIQICHVQISTER